MMGAVKSYGLMFAAMGIAAVAFILFTLYYRSYLRKKNADQLFVSDGSDIRTEHAMFRMLGDFFLTKNFVGRLTRQFEIIEPGDSRKIEKDVLRTFYMAAGVGVACMTVTAVMGLDIYSLSVMVASMYVIVTFVVFRRVRGMETRLLHQIVSFITEVRHQYYMTQSVETAIYEALADAPAPVAAHMERIYEIIIADDIEEETNIYNDHAPNRFLKMFLSICSAIMRFDDVAIGGGDSLFIRNLSALTEEMEVELRRIDALKHKLGVLSLIAFSFTLAMNPVRNWAVRTLPEIEKYYYGTYGTVCFALLLVVALSIYRIIMNMQDLDFRQVTDHVYLDWLGSLKPVKLLILRLKNRNYGRTLKMDEYLHRIGESISVEQLYAKRILCAAAVFAAGLLLSCIIHCNTRQYALAREYEVDSEILSYANDKAVSKLKEAVIRLSEEHKDDSIDLSGIKELLRAQGIVANESWMDLVSAEIYGRIEEYQGNVFMWYELIAIYLATAAGYMAPLWSLRLHKRKMELMMENEIVQFQAGINLLMYIERISTMDILQWMEKFAVVFKPSISACIDDVPYGERRALEKLKEIEPYPAFIKLVDDLMDADRIGIRRAFEEVDADRRALNEKRRQDNEIYVADSSATAGFLVLVPALGVILFYICGPFVMECLNEFNRYTAEMQSFL